MASEQSAAELLVAFQWVQHSKHQEAPFTPSLSHLHGVSMEKWDRALCSNMHLDRSVNSDVIRGGAAAAQTDDRRVYDGLGHPADAACMGWRMWHRLGWKHHEQHTHAAR